MCAAPTSLKVQRATISQLRRPRFDSYVKLPSFPSVGVRTLPPLPTAVRASVSSSRTLSTYLVFDDAPNCPEIYVYPPPPEGVTISFVPRTPKQTCARGPSPFFGPAGPFSRAHHRRIAARCAKLVLMDELYARLRLAVASARLIPRRLRHSPREILFFNSCARLTVTASSIGFRGILPQFAHISHDVPLDYSLSMRRLSIISHHLTSLEFYDAPVDSGYDTDASSASDYFVRQVLHECQLTEDEVPSSFLSSLTSIFSSVYSFMSNGAVVSVALMINALVTLFSSVILSFKTTGWLRGVAIVPVVSSLFSIISTICCLTYEERFAHPESPPPPRRVTQERVDTFVREVVTPPSHSPSTSSSQYDFPSDAPRAHPEQLLNSDSFHRQGDLSTHLATATRFAAVLISFGLLAFCSSGTLKTITITNAARKALNETTTEISSLFDDITRMIFGSTTEAARDSSIALYKRVSEQVSTELTTTNQDYVAKPERFFTLLELHRTVCELVRTIPPREDHVLTTLRNHLQSALPAFTTHLNNVKSMMATTHRRQETVIIHLFGDPGEGKTFALANAIIPALARKLNIPTDAVYTVNLTRENPYWGTYYGQPFGVYDEFLACGEKDPIIPELNRIASVEPMTVAGASVESKEMPVLFKVLFLVSNVPKIDLSNTLNPGAKSAFWSRMHSFEVVNTLTTINMLRDQKRYASDYSHLRLVPFPHIDNEAVYVADARHTFRGRNPLDSLSLADKNFCPTNPLDLWFGLSDFIDYVSSLVTAKERIFHELHLKRPALDPLVVDHKFTIPHPIIDWVEISPLDLVSANAAPDSHEPGPLGESVTQRYFGALVAGQKHVLLSLCGSSTLYLLLAHRPQSVDCTASDTIRALSWFSQEPIAVFPTRDSLDYRLYFSARSSSSAYVRAIHIADGKLYGARMQRVVTPEESLAKQNLSTGNFTISISGPPDTGKTRLAAKLADKLAAVYLFRRTQWTASSFGPPFLHHPVIVTADDASLHSGYPAAWDSLPSRSIVLTTANVKIFPSSHGIFRRSPCLHIDTPSPVPPSWARRAGFCGTTCVNRVAFSSNAINGMVIRVNHLDSYEMYDPILGKFLSVTDDEILQEVLFDYKDFVYSQSSITLEKVSPHFSFPSTATVHIKCNSLKQLDVYLRSKASILAALTSFSSDFSVRFDNTVPPNACALPTEVFLMRSNETVSNLTDAAQYGSRVYGILTSRAPDATVLIEVPDAKILCASRKIQYALLTETVPFESDDKYRIVVSEHDFQNYVTCKSASGTPEEVLLTDVVSAFEFGWDPATPYAPTTILAVDNARSFITSLPQYKLAYNSVVMDKHLKTRTLQYGPFLAALMTDPPLWLKIVAGVCVAATLIGGSFAIYKYISSRSSSDTPEPSSKISFTHKGKLVELTPAERFHQLFSQGSLTESAFEHVMVTENGRTFSVPPSERAGYLDSFLAQHGQSTNNPSSPGDRSNSRMLSPLEIHHNYVRSLKGADGIDESMWDSLVVQNQIQPSSSSIATVHDAILENVPPAPIGPQQPGSGPLLELPPGLQPLPQNNKSSTYAAITSKNLRVAPSPNVSKQGIQLVGPLNPISKDIDSVYTPAINALIKLTCISQASPTPHHFSLYGIGICDRYVIAPAHLLDYARNTKFAIEGMDDYALSLNDGKPWSLSLVVADFSHDLALLEITSLKHPKYKNLVNQFIRRSDAIRVSHGFIVRPSSTKHEILCGSLNVFNYASHESSKYSISHTFRGLGYAFFQGSARPIPTTPGDCGLPYFTTDSTFGGRCIVGFHILRYGSGLSTVVACVTQELIHSFLNQVSRPGIQKQSLPTSASDGTVLPLTSQGMMPIVDSWTIEQMRVSSYDSPRMPNLPDQMDLTFIGFNYSLSKIAKLRAKQYVGEWAQQLKNKTIKQMVPISVDQVADTSRLVKSRAGNPSLLYTQLAKYGTSNCYIGTPAGSNSLHECALALSQMFIDNYSGNHRVLSVDEAINGLYNYNKPYHSMLMRLDQSASAGLFWKRRFNKNTLADMLEKHHESGTETIYRFASDAAGQIALNMIFEQLSWLQNEDCRPYRVMLIQDCLKVELRDPEKCHFGNVRLFNSFDVVTKIIQRMAAGTVLASFKQNARTGESFVGLDPIVDLPASYSRLTEIGSHGFDFDFSNWDKNLHSAVVREAWFLMRAIVFGTTDFTPEIMASPHYRLLQVAEANFASSWHVCEGAIYNLRCGNPSGDPCNTVVNCIANILMNVFVTQHLLAKHNPLLTFAQVATQSRRLVCGDDIIFTLSPKFKFPTFEEYQHAYLALVGMTVTPAEKGQLTATIKPIFDLQFISRTLLPDPHTKLRFPALKKESVIARLTYSVDWKDKMNVDSNLSSALLEASLHDKAFYDSVYSDVQLILTYFDKSVRERVILCPFSTYRRQWHLSIYHFNVCRPLADVEVQRRSSICASSISKHLPPFNNTLITDMCDHSLNSADLVPVLSAITKHLNRTHLHKWLVNSVARHASRSVPSDDVASFLAQVSRHDDSKFSPDEVLGYALKWHFTPDSNTDFTPERIQSHWNAALQHHYDSNPHHPQFHTTREDGIRSPPTDLDLYELVCDWVAVQWEKTSPGATPRIADICTPSWFEQFQNTHKSHLTDGEWITARSFFMALFERNFILTPYSTPGTAKLYELQELANIYFGRFVHATVHIGTAIRKFRANGTGATIHYLEPNTLMLSLRTELFERPSPPVPIPAVEKQSGRAPAAPPGLATMEDVVSSANMSPDAISMGSSQTSTEQSGTSIAITDDTAGVELSLLAVGGALEDAKDAAYRNFCPVGPSFRVSPTTPEGAVIAVIPYGRDVLSTYARSWIAQHERFTGTIELALFMSSPAPLRAAIKLFYIPEHIDGHNYTLEEAVLYKDITFNADQQGRVVFPLPFIDRSARWWTAANPPSVRPAVGIMTYIGVQNPFDNNNVAIVFRLESRLGGDFCAVKPNLEVIRSIAGGGLSGGGALEGLTLGQALRRMGVTTNNPLTISTDGNRYPAPGVSVAPVFADGNASSVTGYVPAANSHYCAINTQQTGNVESIAQPSGLNYLFANTGVTPPANNYCYCGGLHAVEGEGLLPNIVRTVFATNAFSSPENNGGITNAGGIVFTAAGTVGQGTSLRYNCYGEAGNAVGLPGQRSIFSGYVGSATLIPIAVTFKLYAYAQNYAFSRVSNYLDSSTVTSTAATNGLFAAPNALTTPNGQQRVVGFRASPNPLPPYSNLTWAVSQRNSGSFTLLGREATAVTISADPVPVLGSDPLGMPSCASYQVEAALKEYNAINNLVPTGNVLSFSLFNGTERVASMVWDPLYDRLYTNALRSGVTDTSPYAVLPISDARSLVMREVAVVPSTQALPVMVTDSWLSRLPSVTLTRSAYMHTSLRTQVHLSHLFREEVPIPVLDKQAALAAGIGSGLAQTGSMLFEAKQARAQRKWQSSENALNRQLQSSLQRTAHVQQGRMAAVNSLLRRNEAAFNFQMRGMSTPAAQWTNSSKPASLQLATRKPPVPASSTEESFQSPKPMSDSVTKTPSIMAPTDDPVMTTLEGVTTDSSKA